MDKSNIYFCNGKKMRENARWNVNKTIRCLVGNKIKHRKKYKIGKSPSPLGVGDFSILYSPGVRFYMSQKYKHSQSCRSGEISSGVDRNVPEETDRPSRSGEISSGVDMNVSEEQRQFIL